MFAVIFLRDVTNEGSDALHGGVYCFFALAVQFPSSRLEVPP